jgi:mRNA interferase YafQ
MTYRVVLTTIFKKELKVLRKRNKNIEEMHKVIDDIAAGKVLDTKYKDHQLINDKKIANCRECHIEPDWLLIYKIDNKELILLLVETGSHSDLFR